jgi:hypothetical protein
MDPTAAHILGRYVLAAGLAVAAVPTLLAWAKPADVGTTPRYQVTAPGAGNAFLLDTHTGQTWSRFLVPGQGFQGWTKDGATTKSPLPTE